MNYDIYATLHRHIQQTTYSYTYVAKVIFILSHCFEIFAVFLFCMKPRMRENKDHGNVKVGCNNKMQNKNKTENNIHLNDKTIQRSNAGCT